MQWTDILAGLNDLPDTFLRVGPNFTAFQLAVTNGLHKFTNGAEGSIAQAQAKLAIGKWLDVVGLARNIPRYDSESDTSYFARIQFLLTTPGGPPNAIAALLKKVLGVTVPISENFSAVSWSATLPTYLSPAMGLQVANALSYIRPAGIPYTIGTLRGGLYLNTVNYLGRRRSSGTFLVTPDATLSIPQPVNTNNAIAALPTLYLTDPTINP